MATTKAVAHIASLISSTDADVMENYLRWHVVHDKANYLPKAFVEEHFEFF